MSRVAFAGGGTFHRGTRHRPYELDAKAAITQPAFERAPGGDAGPTIHSLAPR